MTFSITKNGKPLSKRMYKWDEEMRIFSTKENNLVLDFSDYRNVKFITGSYCIFTTGESCTFTTGNYCNFKTEYSCTFTAGSCCSFTTGDCCTFKTKDTCTFNTGHSCTFTTGYSCTFNVYNDCEFTVGKECSIIRRDVFEVITPEPNKKIKLRDRGVKGYHNEDELLIKDIIE